MANETDDREQPLLVLAEFVCSEEGDAEFRRHLEQTLTEARSVDGCLHAVVWTRPNRRYQFSTLWTDRAAVARWVANDFHRNVLMPGFRKWCTQGWFGEYRGRARPPARDPLREVRPMDAGPAGLVRGGPVGVPELRGGSAGRIAGLESRLA